METVQSFTGEEGSEEGGMAGGVDVLVGGTESWKSAALPHSLMTQSGASRSVAPARLLSPTRFLEDRASGSVNW